jgi:hypothetical protein
MRHFFHYDFEPLRNMDFYTIVTITLRADGSLYDFHVQFRCRSVELFKVDFLQQRTLSLQLSSFPSYVQAFFNRLSKSEYVEYRTGLLSAIKTELAAGGVEFPVKK